MSSRRRTPTSFAGSEGRVHQGRRPAHQAPDAQTADRVLQGRRELLLHQHSQDAAGREGVEGGRRPSRRGVAAPAARRSRKRARWAVPLGGFRGPPAARGGRPIPARGSRGDSGLPKEGMWRASFAIEDINGDGVPDIVAPPARIGDGELHVWIGDGKGRFTPWTLSFTEAGKPNDRCSHRLRRRGGRRHRRGRQAGRRLRLARHRPRFASSATARAASRSCARAFPQRDFSAQAVVLLDADGDGKLDIVASRDSPERRAGPGGRQDAGSRLPVPRTRAGLGVPEGRPRRRVLLEQPARPGTTTATAARTS